MIPIAIYLKDTTDKFTTNITGDYSSLEGIFEYQNTNFDPIIIDDLTFTMSTTSANGVIDQFGSAALTNGFDIVVEHREGGVISLVDNYKVKNLVNLTEICNNNKWNVYDDGTNFMFSASFSFVKKLMLKGGDKLQIRLTDNMSNKGLVSFRAFVNGYH